MRISDWSSDVFSSDLLIAFRSLTCARSPVFPVGRSIDTSRRKTTCSIPSPATSATVSDRKSVVSGKSVSVRVDPGGRRIIKKKNHTATPDTENPHLNNIKIHNLHTLLDI